MIGTLLVNRYELLEKIGEGGMGIVYKAKCHLLNRVVAVKILKAELSNDENFVARFKREATSVASLSHINIVNVHDVGAENNINFIVMEYINGKTLKQVIKENGRVTSKKTLEIALQIAKALECAHKNKIIHRDIKPDNIMIMEDNIVKVTDFGIAKVVDSRTITNSNKVMGSAHYFSPEQAKGNFVDCRTDIYSLGIVMYEMLTGRVPYNAESSISIAMMHIQKAVVPPQEIITDIPDNVNMVVLKALEKEPIKRYQTAKEIGDDLRAIKENPNFKINLNNSLSDATKIVKPVVGSDIRDEFTTVMSQAADPEKSIIKKDRKALSRNKRLSANKKVMIIIASIILVLIVGVLGKFLFKGRALATPIAIVKTTDPKAVEKLSVKEKTQVEEEKPVEEKVPVDEKKFVPELIGSTQDVAEKTIGNNEYLIGKISRNYSETVVKGLVVSQTPEVNTSYEKGGKIDLVISQGKKIVQVTVPQLNGKTIDEAGKILDDIQLELGDETPVKKNDKESKGNHSKDDNKNNNKNDNKNDNKNNNKNDNEKIFMQNIEAGTMVDMGTKINVSYYEN